MKTIQNCIMIIQELRENNLRTVWELFKIMLWLSKIMS
jgi:hypothetical protein